MGTLGPLTFLDDGGVKPGDIVAESHRGQRGNIVSAPQRLHWFTRPTADESCCREGGTIAELDRLIFYFHV